MISDAEFAHLIHRFPALRAMQSGERADFVAAAQAVGLDAGATVFEPGAVCESFLWLTDGSVRVTAGDGGAREILLYRVAPGELCVFTTSCALSHTAYPAAGRTEEPTRAIALPAGRFESLVQRSSALRGLVFASLSTRLHEVMALVESVTFHRLEQRVAAWILESAADRDGTALEVSHQEVADELGSTREPVSRVLSALERDGLLELGRRRIAVSDAARLRTRAGL